jgi:DNA-directed RNA polymerase beta' subunit
LKITLLDINRFIIEHKLKEVSNVKISNKGFDPQSIWSVEIFGSTTSKARKETFAYIDLKTKIINPNCYTMLKTCSEAISRLLDRKIKYKVVDKILKEDPAGDNGLAFLTANFDNIDLIKNCKKTKLSAAQYLENNKSIVIIDKFLVIPAGYRDRDINTRNGIEMSSDLNDCYRDIIYTCSKLSGISDIDSMIIDNVQLAVNRTLKWFQDNMKGKKGILRGSMLKKRMDFSSRLIASTDQNIPIGHIGLPWHTVLALYEPLFTNYAYNKDPAILEDIGKFIQKPSIDFSDFKKFLEDITALPQIVPDELRHKLEFIAGEIIKDGQVIVKRDPCLMRNNWCAMNPTITEGRVAKINALDIGPMDGDFDF